MKLLILLVSLTFSNLLLANDQTSVEIAVSDDAKACYLEIKENNDPLQVYVVCDGKYIDSVISGQKASWSQKYAMTAALKNFIQKRFRVIHCQYGSTCFLTRD